MPYSWMPVELPDGFRRPETCCSGKVTRGGGDRVANMSTGEVLMQMAFETEVGAILVKQITPPAGLATSTVCERRRYIDVDIDIQAQSYLINPALTDLANTPNMPLSYVDFIVNYLATDYPRYRMSAIATALCVAKVLQ